MDTSETDNVGQFLLFSPRFLEQHAGAVLSDPTVALVEIVANSWDAGATRLEISWPVEAMVDQMRFVDNGHGMTEEEFQVRWRTLSYDRRQRQGSRVQFPESAGEVPERPAFGRNGIGRHGAFCFGDEYQIATWRDGTGVRYRVRRGTTTPVEIDLIERFPSDGHGTEILISNPKPRGLEPEDVRSIIGLRFLTDPLFKCFVNGEEVGLRDIPPEQLDRQELEVPGVGLFPITLLDTRSTDKTAKQHGVAWQVNRRLVGECSWAGTGHEKFLDGRRAEAKRYTFLVSANPLEEAVLQDWSGFDKKDPGFITAHEVIQGRIAEWLIELTKEKRAETTKAVTEANRASLRRLGPISREKWSQFVEEAQSQCPSISEKELIQLGGVLAKLELSRSKYALIERLHELEPDDLDGLEGVLKEWTVGYAKVVLDELKGRLILIRELLSKMNDPATDEVRDLQPLFERGLWIFGPEYETIEYTSNRGMTTVIQKLFGGEGTGSRRRPDFVILPDGTSGLYSYPRYDDDAGESGVDKVVIVELKRPSVSVGAKEKEQPWQYVKELLSRGLIDDGTQVKCFVLGSQIEAEENDVVSRKDGSVKIQPLIYETVLQRAKSRVLNLFDRVKDSPFLSADEIEEFLSEDAVAQTELEVV